MASTSSLRRIVILLHARDRDAERRPFILWTAVAAWRRRGIEVTFVHGPDRRVDADVAINHVNLTVLPEAYRQALARYPVAINGRAVDISKTRVSRHLVRPGDGWTGPVIVKTVLNYGGKPERRLLGLDRRWRDRLRRGLKRVATLGTADALALAGRTGARLDSMAYPVLESPADVPLDVWANPGLVVERFLPEREGEGYVLRMWTFFGQRGVGFRSIGASPVMKNSTAGTREEIGPHPGAVAAAARFGLDYGKVDYVVRDGEVVVFDVNRTPSHAATVPRERWLAAGENFADGLDGLLAQRR